MNSDEITSKGYLEELYRETDGKLEGQVSMHEVGGAIGLEKSDSSRIAEELMVQGLVELKTLAGGIGITTEGLEFLGYSRPVSIPQSQSQQLSNEQVANESDRAIIEKLTAAIKETLSSNTLEYQDLETVVIDLKSIELQLLSPKPKIGVIKELFRSIRECLASGSNVSGPLQASLDAVIQTGTIL